MFTIYFTYDIINKNIIQMVMKMTKTSVLAILKNSDGYISGEEMSRKLQISRAAVNAAVQTLRKEGYDISSSTNKGYTLKNSPDKLNTGELLALLPEDWVENIMCLNTTGSTNTFLRQLAQQNADDGFIVIANEQTAGRGRLGRDFQSNKDKGIYLSMLMRLNSTPAETANITAWVAVAVCNAIETVYGVKPGIKWVNDIILNGKKVCGILTEMSVEGESGHVQYVVTGLGINVNYRQSDFAEEIRLIASSLAIETGKEISRALFAAEIIKNLKKMRADWPNKKSEYLSAYRERCIILGKDVRVIRKENEERGTAEGIDDNFGLVVRFADGHTESITSGEVSVRGFYGYI